MEESLVVAESDYLTICHRTTKKTSTELVFQATIMKNNPRDEKDIFLDNGMV
jgi:hypothetical protein